MRDEYVWAHVEPGTIKRVKRSVAKAEGWRVDRRKPHKMGAPPGPKLHLTPELKKAFFHQTGKHVDDAGGMAAAFRDTNTRPAEKGEHCYDQFDALKEHAETGKPLDDRFKTMDMYGDIARSEKFNAEERYAYHRARLGDSRSHDAEDEED